jgi:IclR family transcriptional regulator, KDG regulon repressor
VTTSNVGKSSTVLRALKVLEIVGESSEAVSAADVAQEIGADRSTTYRMLATLEHAGYVVRDESGKKFKLSYKVISLGRNLLAEDEQDELIRSVLRELAATTNETVNFSILEGTETVIIMRAKGLQLVSVDFQVGDRAAVHCTSIGKALLAYQDKAFIEEVIAQGLPLVAKKTITDPDVFRAELKRIRSQGYAIDDGEFADEMRCIAIPVFENGGRVKGGINFSGPSTRFTYEKLDELKDLALNVARQLSEKLGGVDWPA